MKNLMQLLIDNKLKGSDGNLNITNEVGKDTIYIYDIIVADDHWGGVSALAFTKALNGLNAPTIHLRINSPGGDVFASRTIEQAIKEHPSNIIAHIDGYAASAATYIAMAANETRINDGALFMIQKASTLSYGNMDDFLQMAALLDKVDDTLVKTYNAKTGIDGAELKQMMKEETWLSAEEAVDMGFVDTLVTDENVKDQIEWDLSAYKNAPKISAKVKAAKAAKIKAEADQVLADEAHEHREREYALLIANT